MLHIIYDNTLCRQILSQSACRLSQHQALLGLDDPVRPIPPCGR